MCAKMLTKLGNEIILLSQLYGPAENYAFFFSGRG